MAKPDLLGRDLVMFRHWFGCRGHCLGCQLTLEWNLHQRFCHCGAPATGFRALGPDVLVEFFCDEHFQDVPGGRVESAGAEGDVT